MTRLLGAIRAVLVLLFGRRARVDRILDALSTVDTAPAVTDETQGTPPQDISAHDIGAQDIGALRLLGTLQSRARLIDFIQEDIATYQDAEIGAAVRSIHADCQTVFRETLDIVPVLEGAEEEEITVSTDLRPEEVRLVGDIQGDLPFQGILRHRGWRSLKVTLPKSTLDRPSTLLAPAEIEVSPRP